MYKEERYAAAKQEAYEAYAAKQAVVGEGLKQREVRSALDEAHSFSIAVRRHLDSLEERLCPALSPSRPEEPAAEKGQCFSSPLAMELQTHSNELRIIAERLEDLTSRLEL